MNTTETEQTRHYRLAWEAIHHDNGVLYNEHILVAIVAQLIARLEESAE